MRDRYECQDCRKRLRDAADSGTLLTGRKEVATDPGQFVSLIALDMDAYAAKYGSNAVKKTLTIPAWLNTFVEQNGISCSKVLQDALSKMAQAR